MRPPFSALLLLPLLFAPAAHAENAAQTAQRLLDREMSRDLGRDGRGGGGGAEVAGATARVDALESDRVPLLTVRGLQDDTVADRDTLVAPAPAPMLGGNLPP